MYPIDNTYLDKTSPELQFGTILEPIQLNQEPLISSVVVVPVKITAWQTQNEMDFTVIALDYGGKCIDSSANVNPELYCGKIQQGVDIPLKMIQYHPSDTFCGRLNKLGTLLNGKLYQHQNLERHTKGRGLSLLPTPMTMTKPANAQYSRPGLDRLESRLRILLPTPLARDGKHNKQGNHPDSMYANLGKKLEPLISKGFVSHPNLREWMMGVPQDSTLLVDPAGGKLTPLREKYQPQLESHETVQNELLYLETAVRHSNQQSVGNISTTYLVKKDMQTLNLKTPTQDKLLMTTTALQSIRTDARPFVKWCGGKKALIPQIQPLLPDIITKYCEPFIGGGAMLYHILANYHPTEVLINDINPDLSLAYKIIRDYPLELIDRLQLLQTEYIELVEDDRRDYFHMIRDLFNKRARLTNYAEKSDRTLERAAQFIFINKSCFNGLWRVRKSDGGVNSPFGAYNSPKICDDTNLMAVSKSLQNTDIRCGSYANCADFIDSDTFVYLDPPYTPVSATSNFVGYSKNGWSFKDNADLQAWLIGLDDIETKVMLSSSDCDVWLALKLLKWEFNIVRARRSINSDGAKRGEVNELVIRNY